jgi:hypothetical protein
LYGTPLFLSIFGGLLVALNFYESIQISKRLETVKIRAAYVSGALAGVCLATGKEDPTCQGALTDKMGMWLQTEINMARARKDQE